MLKKIKGALEPLLIYTLLFLFDYTGKKITLNKKGELKYIPPEMVAPTFSVEKTVPSDMTISNRKAMKLGTAGVDSWAT